MFLEQAEQMGSMNFMFKRASTLSAPLRIGQMHAVDHKSLDMYQMVRTCPY
jgi:hypothetical protein